MRARLEQRCPSSRHPVCSDGEVLPKLCGAFESVNLRIMLMGRVEMFEPEDRDLARARFEELRTGGAAA